MGFAVPIKNGNLYGSLAEWSKAADLKSVDGAEPSVGSNPTTPAKKNNFQKPLDKSKIYAIIQAQNKTTQN